jgi:hypothetical protein
MNAVLEAEAGRAVGGDLVPMMEGRALAEQQDDDGE